MSYEVVRPRFSFVGGVLKILFVLAIVVAVAGYFLGWYSFSTASDESGDDSKVGMTVTVNKDEVKRDADKLKDKLVGLKDAAGLAAKIQTVEGKIASIDMAKGELVVQPSNSDKPTTVTVDDETEFKLGNGKSSLSKLSKGDGIVVTYVKKDGIRRAKKISLLDTQS